MKRVVPLLARGHGAILIHAQGVRRAAGRAALRALNALRGRGRLWRRSARSLRGLRRPTFVDRVGELPGSCLVQLAAT